MWLVAAADAEAAPVASRRMAERRRKFWGWGYEDQQPPAAEVEQAGRGAREHLGFGPGEVEPPPRLEDVELPPPRIEPPASLAHICRSDPYERVSHAYGKAYRDLVRAFRGRFDHPPDVVAHPGDERELEQLLDWCAGAGAAAIPFGGGTSVVGGVEPRVPQDAVVTIDLKRMNRVLEVDPVSRAARIQAGATGPELEEQLKDRGMTLRHFPQSFELSTLGGWIATRAGGHYATLHTHIDDFVESVRAITPAGAWESRRLPGSGAGPSPDRMLIGSEGILGVITEAWVRVQEPPAFRESAAVLFDGFEPGAEAVRALAQSRLFPSNCRLLDPGEAALTGAAPLGKALLVLGFEAPAPVDGPMAQALELCRDHGGEPREDAAANRGRVEGRLPAGPLPARHPRGGGHPRRDVRERRHLGPAAGLRERGSGANRGGAGGRGPRDLPSHARLPRRRRAVLHGAGAGPARRRARAVGRGEGGRL